MVESNNDVLTGIKSAGFLLIFLERSSNVNVDYRGIILMANGTVDGIHYLADAFSVGFNYNSY